MPIKCIDVSNHQGVIPVKTWVAMKHDIPCCIIRSSFTYQKQTFTMEKDASFEKNIENAHKAGMMIGTYHYSQATSEKEAEEEAKFAEKIIKPYKKYITLPVAYDCEFGGRFNASVAKKIGKVKMMAICDAFCKPLKKAGYTTMVYANLSTLNNYISAKLPDKNKIWVAQYNSTCDYKKPKYMWQFSSKQRVKGIDNYVDMSYIYDPELEKKFAPKGKAYPHTLPKLPRRGYFRKGDRGTNVVYLQEFLKWCLGVTLAADGDYGFLTIGAVKKFQSRYALAIDGKFGKECLEMARKVRK